MPHDSVPMQHNSDAMPDQKSEPFTVSTNDTVPQISSHDDKNEKSEPSDEISTEKAGKPSEESSSEGNIN